MELELIQKAFPKSVLTIAPKGVVASYYLDEGIHRIDESFSGERKAVLANLVASSLYMFLDCDGKTVFKVGFYGVPFDVAPPSRVKLEG